MLNWHASVKMNPVSMIANQAQFNNASVLVLIDFEIFLGDVSQII